MLLTRSADHSTVLAEEPGGGYRIFDAAANRFTPRTSANTSYGGLPAAVNPDGSLFAALVWPNAVVFDRSFNTVATLPGIVGGAAFDARRDVLYGIDPHGQPGRRV